MAEYSVVLLDRDGCETVNDTVDGMPAAKKRAKYLLSPAFAGSVGTTHDVLLTSKVEIRDQVGKCLWDAFL